jgi:hypothetical protein
MRRIPACLGWSVLAVTMGVVLVHAGPVEASPVETSWIFRSAVSQGQSMWGPGTLTSYNFSDHYYVTTWPINGTGFSWALQAEQGIVSGNVEGLMNVKYDSYVHGSSTTTIHLSYGALDEESRIATSLAVSLTATPRLRVEILPWPFPSVDWSLPISMLNMAVGVNKDYASTLGQPVTGSGSYKLLPFAIDLALANAHLDFTLGQDVWFTPQSIAGTVNCTHLESGATRDVSAFLTTNGTDVSIDLPLDLKGHWEIDLDNFHVQDNIFGQSLNLAADLGIGIPMLGADYTVAGGFSLYRNEFSLPFQNHAGDGDPSTDDNLGRFCIYVDPGLPEPSTVGLLAIGAGLLGLRRKAPMLHRA